MTQMTSFAAQTDTQTDSQTDSQTDNLTTPAAQDNKGRMKYSGNEVLRLLRALNEARLDMDRKCLSMNGVVHIVQERIEEMLQSRRFSYADLARLITSSGFPVTARTLKDYLAQARKDAKEGRTAHSELKKLILAAAQKQETQEYADTSVPCPATVDDSHDEESVVNADDDFATPDNDWLASSVSCAMNAIETKNMKRQHVQDIYAARKRRKKARKHK